MKRRLVGAMVLVAACTATAAQQALYKWTDEGGTTHFSDRPPRNFKGKVVRIDTSAAPPPVATPANAQDAKPQGAAELPSDYLAKRRAQRNALEASRARARANLEEAKKALADGSEPLPEELQVIGHRADNQGGRDGPSVARSNCRQVTGADGKPATLCAGMVRGQEFEERIARLQESLRKAEDELSAAQADYARGVD